MQAVALPQLRESPAHQAVIPDQIDRPPALLELPLRWEPGPSFEEALASARGPEKAAADLLPLDATFDPETHEGAGKPVTLSMMMLLFPDDKVCALQSQAHPAHVSLHHAETLTCLHKRACTPAYTNLCYGSMGCQAFSIAHSCAC